MINMSNTWIVLASQKTKDSNSIFLAPVVLQMGC